MSYRSLLLNHRSTVAGALAALCCLLAPVTLASAAEPVRFNRDIKPILSNRCFLCHGPNDQEGDLRLDERELAIESVIVPGNSAKSELIARITNDDEDELMPPPKSHKKRLSAKEVDLIRRWIDEGAKYESHWAFVPPQRPAAPAVNKKDWSPLPIDQFVLAKLEANGLTPAERASRETLIRRVTLDLTGLPPTPAEVKAFVADKSPNAYDKVVDRLLASPRFGEQRAKHWLDVARYADSNGYQYDTDRQQWVWRDWVIHSFNSNKPFDQFTIEQMAGDLLPNATNETRLATGFHRNHPITIEGGVIDEEYRTEYVMDRVVTTSTAWMGMTFLCARCHDHKYDPIAQKDFYSFYAFFNNVPERGLNGFAPQAKLPSPLHSGEQVRLTARVAELEKQLAAVISTDQISKWEQELKATDDAWKMVTPAEVVSTGGSTFTRLADGSYLASGKNPATDNYDITFTVGDKPLRAIRIEALTDNSHVNKSTGRGSNGNFVLAEAIVSSGASAETLQPVNISAAAADYQQKGYPAAAAIDGKLGSAGWAVDGNSRIAPSVLTLTLSNAIPVGSTVRLRLVHTFGASHMIGRFRLSEVGPAPPLSPAVSATLAVATDKRTPAQRSQLREYLVQRFGGKQISVLSRELGQTRQALAAMTTAVPNTLILAELPKPRQTYVLDRGEYHSPIKEQPVTPAVPTAMGKLPEGAPSNRLGLAQWMVARDNPLTARVTVNRYWAQLFGTGLVETVEDFGAQGEYPSHPDLLDWLAVEFIDSGWDVKQLFKTIVTSETYKQSSRVTPEAHANDPMNRLLARGPRYRLSAETIRDSALMAGGLLDERVGGASAFPYHPQGLWLEINNRPGYSRAYPHQSNTAHLYRRSMYTYWKRTVPPPSMATFDAPEREFCVARRSRTNTPLQSFVLLHDPQFVEAARMLAERMVREGGKTTEQRLTHGFQVCTGRRPAAAELAILIATYNERLTQYQSETTAAEKLLTVGQAPRDPNIDMAELAAMTSAARLLLNLSEFITKG